MNWFLIALINPLAHAFVNHFDKYFISRYAKEGSVGSLILVSSLFAVVVLPVLFLINPGILGGVTFSQALILMINGALLMVAVLLYLYGLESDEASHAIPMLELIPVISFFLGYLVLGEVLQSNQLLAAGYVIVGSTVLSLDLGAPKAKFKTCLFALMLGASFFFAINAVIFKFVAIEQGFVDSLFWDMLGKVLFGLVLFATVRSYRKDFLSLVNTHRHSILGLNAINETIGLVGDIALVYAVLLAPVALVQAVGGLQAMFVFILGVLITLLFPKFSQESLLRHHLFQKITGILIISIGVYLLEGL